jgi:hypothetical protein
MRYGRNQETQIQFLIRTNYGVGFKKILSPVKSELRSWFFKKNLLAGETGVREFSKPGEGFFLIMKSCEAV